MDVTEEMIDQQNKRIYSALDEIKSGISASQSYTYTVEQVLATIITNLKRGDCTIAQALDWYETEGKRWIERDRPTKP